MVTLARTLALLLLLTLIQALALALSLALALTRQRGKRHGEGSYLLTSGARYVGEWRDGERHGKGVQLHPDP